MGSEEGSERVPCLEEIGIEWIEEPLYGYDFEGLAELRKRTTLHVPAAS